MKLTWFILVCVFNVISLVFTIISYVYKDVKFEKVLDRLCICMLCIYCAALLTFD